MHYVGDSGSLLRFLVRKREMEKRKSEASIEVDRDERKLRRKLSKEAQGIDKSRLERR